MIAGGPNQREGVVYVYDKPNGRIIAIEKTGGDYVAQYRPAGNAPDWADIRAIAVTPAVEEVPATLTWISKDGVHQTLLEAVPDAAPAVAGAIGRGVAQPGRDHRQADQEAVTRGSAVIPLRDANPTRRTSVVTIGIVVACFVAFAYELGLLASGGESALDAFVTQWGVVPAELTAAWGRGDFLSVETATLITSQFMHAGWLHLLGNMLYLWIFANNVEDRMGRLGFLVFYLAGGVAAGLAQVAVAPSSTIPMPRGIRRHRRRAGGLPRLLPAGADHVARVPRLLLPAHRRPGGPRARVLVRPPADRRAHVDRDGRDERRRRVLRPHRRVRRGRPRRRGSCAGIPGRPGRPPAPAAVG